MIDIEGRLMKSPKRVNNPKVWNFDVDDTLVMWNLSEYQDLPTIEVPGCNGVVTLAVNQKNINLLIKLAHIGWYIRVHSGSGVDWAEKIVVALNLMPYVDSIETKALGNTDDQPHGDGIAYSVYREAK